METLYVRTAEGACMDMPIGEAIEQFLSNDGYRITISLGKVDIVIRKHDDLTDSVDKLMDQHVVNASVTIRDRRSSVVPK
jgi:hypothetical protein